VVGLGAAALGSDAGLTRDRRQATIVRRSEVGSDQDSTGRPPAVTRDKEERPVIFDLIGFIIFGLVVGAVARLLKPGKQNLSVLATLLLGLAGSVIGGLVASLLGTGDIFELNIIGAIVAIVAAFLLIGLAEGTASKSRSRV
jgi:uncharacterized membrane protein YeaQ/YmgE (transglycosylase-associated protein family)